MWSSLSQSQGAWDHRCAEFLILPLSLSNKSMKHSILTVIKGAKK
jgi:hypothetical protein